VTDLYSEKHLKTLYDRRIVAFFWKIGVAESNDNVKILNESSEIAVSAHVQYKCEHETAQGD